MHFRYQQIIFLLSKMPNPYLIPAACYTFGHTCKYCADTGFESSQVLADHELLCRIAKNLDPTGKPMKDYKKKVAKSSGETSFTGGSKDDPYDVSAAVYQIEGGSEKKKKKKKKKNKNKKTTKESMEDGKGKNQIEELESDSDEPLDEPLDEQLDEPLDEPLYEPLDEQSENPELISSKIQAFSDVAKTSPEDSLRFLTLHNFDLEGAILAYTNPELTQDDGVVETEETAEENVDGVVETEETAEENVDGVVETEVTAEVVNGSPEDDGVVETEVTAEVVNGSDPSAARENEVQAREWEVAGREWEVAGREQAVTERENAVTEREVSVAAREIAVTNREVRVVARELAVTNREVSVAARELAVTNREVRVVAREGRAVEFKENLNKFESVVLRQKEEAVKFKQELNEERHRLLSRELAIKGRETALANDWTEVENKMLQRWRNAKALEEQLLEFEKQLIIREKKVMESERENE